MAQMPNTRQNQVAWIRALSICHFTRSLVVNEFTELSPFAGRNTEVRGQQVVISPCRTFLAYHAFFPVGVDGGVKIGSRLFHPAVMAVVMK